ncbi:DUF1887 [Desulfonema limicola]|uniref:DUF1887 n=1 Tax=Desulfonema limicola TaxID=45656 RepID=A0A975B7I7_9BACT|nr:DUF1887 family CARF protein [Desulfonema limicola]QTA80253.1 DUF1887 [Desulfonema limicola]
MEKILISLISDQTIPNVLLIRELSEIDRYIFITTARMESQKKSDWIIDAAQIPENKYLKVEVVEDSLANIQENLRKIDFEDDDEFYVNLTGGTKIMSIGVYNFFRQRRSEIYYIPIGKNVYRKIFPEVKNRENPIYYRAGFEEYLKSYGIKIINPKNGKKLVKTADYTNSFYQKIQHLDTDELGIINDLRKFRNEKTIAVNEIAGLDSFLDKVEFPQNTSANLGKNEIKYLTGEWFEEYVYTLIQKALNLDDDFIGLNINIRRNEVDNEFDVMFTIENALHVIECKSFIYDSISGKNILNESLYKLAALKKDFGLYVKSYIFTLSDRGTDRDNVKQSFIDRSNLLDIKIIDKTFLENEFDEFINKIRG